VSEDSENTAKKPKFARTRRGVRKFFSLYTYSLVGDVGAEIESKKRTWSSLKALISAPARRREESFAQAMQRLGVDEEALAKRLKVLRMQTTVYLGVAVIAFVMLTMSPFVARPLTNLLMSLGVFGLCVTRGGIARFRVCQIEQRDLFGFRQWIERGLR
jgi:hypothetical protein